MIGFIIAATLVILKLGLSTTLTESAINTAIIQASSFLFWWYLITSVASLIIATLSHTGDLGTEGARMRFGIASPLSWMVGLYRIQASNFWAVLFLAFRRVLLVGGAYLMMQSFSSNPVGNGFISGQFQLILGGLLIAAGLATAFFKPHFRQNYPSVRMREVSP